MRQWLSDAAEFVAGFIYEVAIGLAIIIGLAIVLRFIL